MTTTNDTTRLARTQRRLIAIGFALFGLMGFALANSDPFANSAPAAQEVYSAQSATCIEVHGQTPTDRARALAFCAQGVSKGTVTGVIAMDTLLWLKVTPEIAGALRLDSVATEQLVKNYLRGWRMQTGRKAASVYLEFGDVELARGETTMLGSDTVTIRH